MRGSQTKALASIPRQAAGHLWLALNCLSVAVFVLMQASSVAFSRPLDDVIASKNIRIIAYNDNKPFSYLDENGEPKGIDVDIGKAIAAELGVEPEIILRMPGETADDDVRVNVWQGPRTGGGVGDIVLHIPYDHEFRVRNMEAVIVNPYFQEEIAVAIHTDMIPKSFTFDRFKSPPKIGVQLASVADYFLMTYEDGALIDNIAHHKKPADGVKEFANKEIAALMGVRSLIEGALSEAGIKPVMVQPKMDGIVRKSWVIGMAVHENSRDLGYRVGDIVAKLKTSGEMRKIFAKHGITYVHPDGS